MKVVAIIGGLGSQMFKYGFYLSLKSKTNEKCFIDTSFFAQKECWNGYELKKLFNVNDSDFYDELTNEEKSELKSNVRPYYAECLTHMTKNEDANFMFMGKRIIIKKGNVNKIASLGNYRKIQYLKHSFGFDKYYSVSSFLNNDNDYFDEYFHNSDEHFTDCKDLIKKAFVFPKINELNKKTMEEMLKTESVALHVRRSDHLADNGKLFDKGFYKKAVSYIKEKASIPVFYIFSDDLDWCKNNLETLGLNNQDKIVFVDWNKGDESYRDMQLMTFCQHNVIPISSFSWWGYYLSDRENKIVIAPKKYWLEVPIHL